MLNFDYMLDALINDGEDIVDDTALNNFVTAVLNGQLDTSQIEVQNNILAAIAISNILYNNTDRTILPLEDGVYDLLVVLANNLALKPMVGATPTDIEVTAQPKLRKPFIKCDELQQPFIKLDDKKIESGLFSPDLIKPPVYIKDQFYKRGLIPTDLAKKKVVNIPHEYPKLVGTLDKCKFVLESQAYDLGVLNDANVSVFERDFLRKHMEMGLFGPYDKIRILATLKMDGVSVEATVSDRIISARSRGDTANDAASDLTPALKGIKFPKATGYVTDKDAFGMKFECMLSYQALNMLGDIRNVDYVNPRNAIIGLLGAGDCNQWLEYITLVPLETSLDIDPLEEIVFMNELYASEPLRYAVIEGTYNEVLFQVKQFVEEAEYLRPIMPYMYDGVVLTYIDKDIREALGRENSVNKYSVAVKFNPLKKMTKFLGYTYSIGQNGIVTPKAHYNVVELLGATHSKTTVHSYARFKELGLREGDIVSIELINDVIPYISKADVHENTLNTNPIIEFPTHCPSCGTELVISDSGKSATCPNIDCPERRLTLVTNMLAKLGFKDFSEKSLATLNCVHSLRDLIYIDPDRLDILGPTEKENFLQRIRELLEANMWDFRLVGALGFTNIAAERWASILRKIPLIDIINDPPEVLASKLASIKGVGKSMIEVIITEREMMKDDLYTILENIPHKVSYGQSSGLQIRFSGVRNEELMQELQNRGFDCTGGGVTKQTNILLVPYVPYTSSKTAKLSPDCKIIAIDDFIMNMEKYLV